MNPNLNSSRVSIIIQTWLPENRKYLDLCIRSIRNLDYPQDLLEIIIVARPSYMPEYPGCRTVEPGLGDQYFASSGYNFGYSISDPRSKYIFSINDDVCLTRNSLRFMVEDLGDNFALMTGIAPSEQNASYFYRFPVIRDNTEYIFDKQNYRYEDCAHLHEEMLNAPSYYPWGITIVPFICMFATLIPRKVYEKIGGFDEGFRGGPDDIDYSNRVLAEGGVLLTALHSLIWHFGSVTITHTCPAERWIYNMDYFRKKWGKFPPFVDQKRYDAVLAQTKEKE